MCILRNGFLTGLGLICVMAPLSTAFAATEVTSIDYASEPDGSVQIVLATTGDTPEVSVFATEDPPRIVLDLADTSSSASSDTVSVGAGPVQKYTASSASGRTRLVVELDRSSNYDYTASHDRVVLTVGGAGEVAAAQPAAAVPTPSASYPAGGYVIEVWVRR